MNTTIENIAGNALGQALETMAFIIPMPPEGPPTVSADLMLVSMEFTGPQAGRIAILTGGEVAQSLAANMLGLDPADPEVAAKAADALKELLNTTCGLVLPQLARTPADVFNVTIPQLAPAEQANWDDFCDVPGTALWDLDGRPLALRLELKS